MADTVTIIRGDKVEVVKLRKPRDNEITIMRGDKTEVLRCDSSGRIIHNPQITKKVTIHKKTPAQNPQNTSTFVKKANACIKGANEGMIAGMAGGAAVGAFAGGAGAGPGALIGGVSGAVGGCASGIFKYNI